MAKKKYPEHMKLRAVSDASQKCGEFYAWLQDVKCIEMECHYDYERDEDGYKVWRSDKGRIIKRYTDPDTIHMTTKERERMLKIKSERNPDCRLILKPGGPITLPIRQRTNQLLAEFFEIDEAKLEKEKRQMLGECRAINEKKGK